MKRTRITTTVEKREVVVIRTGRRLKHFFCPQCQEPVALITVDEAVKISGLSARAVYRLIEEGEIHFVETADGGALICPAELLRRVWKDSGEDQSSRKLVRQ